MSSYSSAPVAHSATSLDSSSHIILALGRSLTRVVSYFVALTLKGFRESMIASGAPADSLGSAVASGFGGQLGHQVCAWGCAGASRDETCVFVISVVG